MSGKPLTLTFIDFARGLAPRDPQALNPVSARSGALVAKLHRSSQGIVRTHMASRLITSPFGNPKTNDYEASTDQNATPFPDRWRARATQENSATGNEP